jgi:hypothetical protein
MLASFPSMEFESEFAQGGNHPIPEKDSMLSR